VVLPRELSFAAESDFDFFNDGRVERVFRNVFANRYMLGSTLLVQSDPSSKEATEDPINDPTSWFLPCQLESLDLKITDCAPLSQANDDGGLSVEDVKDHRVVRFVGRYSQVDAVRIRHATYVIIVGQTPDTAGYAAVLKPRSGRKFELLCLLPREEGVKESQADSWPTTYSISGKSSDLDIESLKAKVMRDAQAFCAKEYPTGVDLPYPVMELSFAQETTKRPFTATLDFWCDVP
jgi:hypothetical protein